MKTIHFLILSAFTLLLSCSEDEHDHSSHDHGPVSVDDNLNWVKTFGGSNEEYAKSVASTHDGGFVVVGYTRSEDGDITKKVGQFEDIWLTKYNEKGELQWSKTYGGSQEDFGYSVIENHDRTLVVAGYSKSSDGDVPANIGQHDFFIFKTDANGNIIWKKSYGFISHDHAHKIIATRDGGYFVTGFTDYSGVIGVPKLANKHGVGEYYGIKLNANGDKEWDKYFGGTMNERVFDVVEANGGGFVMVGYSESTDFDVTSNKGGYDYWIVKIDATGKMIWQKSYGGTGLDHAFGIAKTKDDTYIITGMSNSVDGDITKNKGENDVWVISIDDNGNKLWDKSFGGSQSEASSAIKSTSDGNYIITAQSISSDQDFSANKGMNDFWVFSISPKGDMLWKKSFGGTNIDLATDVTQLENKAIVVVGETESTDLDIVKNKGIKDFMIVKTSNK